jgi:hypothetical protein
MIRKIEIKIFDQSNVIFSNILKKKKRDVQKLIDDLLSILSNYIFMFISYREFMFVEELQFKFQSSILLFHMFFSSFLPQIMSKHINFKTSLERNEVSHRIKSWTKSTSAEIDAFIEILLYMSISSMPRIADYWNLDSKRAIHELIVNCMSCQRWEQIKRYLKISDLINDQKIDTRGSYWWKKLNSVKVIDDR